MSALLYDLWDARAGAPVAPDAYLATCWCEWARAQQEGCKLATRLRAAAATDRDVCEFACAKLLQWLEQPPVRPDRQLPPWTDALLDACVARARTY
jgi:hypothetical protein